MLKHQANKFLQLVAINAILGSALPAVLPANAATEPVLKGGVKENILKEETEVKKVGKAVRELKDSADELYDEANFQEVIVINTPNLIGSTVITIPRPQPTGRLLPPRKKYVDLSILEIGNLIPMAEDEIKDMIASLPAAKKDKVAPMIEKIETGMKNARTSYDKLVALQQAGNYQNRPLSDNAEVIYDAMKDIEKLGKKVLKGVKS